ncbi:DgyrCDS4545 [Dimorphilus gyrociliatus]|uniref:Sarcolemmal membrane-associated protein n=1 Tax=Dimorphilus gyrociliatus TaxID=2664684 RepID=A0A7I8VHU6_9ANNE|nr:DgyrCDS4545 [Dimorphilus gyrociliatus]
MGIAILTSRPNSHPFQERQITLNEPTKIGRAVARARPSENNAIYDCKVLSRNHALLWYENNKFYLQDTKSSNGTFVNSHRLSKGSEESLPYEIHSGDILQFGVDVMENSKRVTHSCIIASVQLFHPDGTEAKPIDDNKSIAATSNIQVQELYQLHQFLQEALQREALLESKLAALQRLVSRISESADNGWSSLITEDRLLSRVALLEKRIASLDDSESANGDDENSTLRAKIDELHRQQQEYESTTKESLKTIMEEKLEAVRKLVDLEKSLAVAEQECSQLREACENSQRELSELAEKHDEQMKEVQSLQEELREAEKRHADLVEQTERERTEYEERIEEMIRREDAITAKMEELQADKDFTSQQLTAVRAKLDYKGKAELQNDSSPPDLIKNTTSEDDMELDVDNMPDECPVRRSPTKSTVEVQVALIGSDIVTEQDGVLESEVELQEALDAISTCSSDITILDDCQVLELQANLEKTKEEIEFYKQRLEDTEEKLRASRDDVEKLTLKLERAEVEAIESAAQINTLTENLRLADTRMNEMVENACEELKHKLEESQMQDQDRQSLSETLQSRVRELEEDLDQIRNSLPDLANSNTPISSIATHLQTSLSSINDLQQEVSSLKEQLQHTEEARMKYEDHINVLKDELERVKTEENALKNKTDGLESRLNCSQNELKVKSEKICILEDELRKAENLTNEVKPQIISLQERLLAEEADAKRNMLENQKLRSELQKTEEQLKKYQELNSDVKDNFELKKRLRKAEDEIARLKSVEISVKNTNILQFY